MRKTVEIEYVGIEDVQEIMDDALAVMREGIYVSIDFFNISNPMFSLRIKLDGYDAEKFDYDFSFYLSDTDSDVKGMNDCKAVLRNLLAEG